MQVPRRRRRAARLLALIAGRRALGPALAAIAIGGLASRAARAHPIDFSMFYAEADGSRVRVTFDMHPRGLIEALPALDRDGDGTLSRDEIGAGAPVVTRYLDQGFAIRSESGACVPEAPSEPRLVGGVRVQLARAYGCARAPSALTFAVRAFTEIQGGHTMLGRMRLGGAYEQFMFKPGAETKTLASPAPEPPRASPPDAAAPAPPSTSLGAFLRLGVEHVLRGIDHVLFVAGLSLATRRARELLVIITAFTIAHSLSLALGALGVVTVPPRLVESMIAASLVWVGVENIVTPAPRRRALLAAAFGLLHGLGFAGALRDVGLTRDHLIGPLVAFNAGVEVGQLLVVIPAYLLLGCLRRTGGRERAWTRALSAGVACAGGAWLADRALDLRWLP